MLYDEGVFALPIVFPMVARNKARIRTMMNAGHTRADLDEALAAFEKIGRKLRFCDSVRSSNPVVMGDCAVGIS